MSTFQPFTGHGPCPKCGSPEYRTVYHEQGWLDPDRACWDLDAWPRDGQGDPLSLEEGTMESEEHLHRTCATCGFETIEALATEEQRRPTHRYAMVTGIEQINASADDGWKVVAAWGTGVQISALVEAPR
jgi:hypothetical protein